MIATQQDFGKVAVLMGGWSAEREVSLSSGKACTGALQRAGFKVVPIDVKRETIVADLVQGFRVESFGSAILAALGSFIGHLHPVWLKFKGGKGVATFLGLVVALHWPSALVFIAAWLATAYLTRYSSAGRRPGSGRRPAGTRRSARASGGGNGSTSGGSTAVRSCGTWRRRGPTARTGRN